MPSPCFTLTLPSELRMLAVARSFVEAVCQACDLAPNTARAIVLATAEAVSNIVRHAHHGRPTAQIQVQCSLHPYALEIILLDEGEPFDLAAVPHLEPSEMRVGGRGVYLMRTLMDELTCVPRQGRGNTLRMVKRWALPSSVPKCG
jgi:anti-sigma regulatory factor (Ser/Thr protein kinase)